MKKCWRCLASVKYNFEYSFLVSLGYWHVKMTKALSNQQHSPIDYNEDVVKQLETKLGTAKFRE